MSNSDLSFVIIAACLANILITYFIVRSATSSSTKVRYMEIQISLLARIAKQNGVAAEDVDKILGKKIDWKRLENAN
jgi:hypothetical protein